MSQVIDRKIVDMEFNNSRFESNVQTTLGTLDKLKRSLNFKGIQDSFLEIETASQNVKMSKFGSAVETVSSKFSVLEQIAIGALRNIGKQASDMAASFVKSVSIDQVSAGWQKYAEKTSSVQTIMAATRKEFEGVDNQMELVEEQLGRLNWFTDETSYKFVDMVNNIGKFTSAGVKLETATTAMQGIATWAAISGANAEQASHAMYNLSQALGVGAVTAIDWKSIENANMATMEFKETAIQTALAMGTLKKTSKGTIETLKGNEVTIANFRDALKDKWLTSDVLMKTLDIYGGFTNKLKEAVDETGISTTEFLNHLEEFEKGTLDIDEIAEETGVTTKKLNKIFKELSSDTYDLGKRAFKAAQEAKTFQEAVDYVKEAVSTGWMNTFELIFGNYEQAKKLWSDVAENFYTMFVESGDNRNDLLRAALYKDEWDEFSESISKTKVKMKDLSKEDRKLAKELDLTAKEFKGLKKMAKETGTPIQELAKDFKKLSGRDLLIQSIYNSFDALLKIIDTVKTSWHNVFPETTADQIYSVIEKFEKFTSSLILSDEKAEKVERTLTGLFSVLDTVRLILKPIVDGFFDVAKAIFDFDLALEGSSKLGDFLLRIHDTVKESKGLKNLFKTIIGIYVGIINYVKETIKGNTNLSKIIKLVVDPLKNLLSKLKEFKDKLTEKWTSKDSSGISMAEKTFLFLDTVFGRVYETLKKVWPTLKGIFDKISEFGTKFWTNVATPVIDFFKKLKENEAVQKALGFLYENLKKIFDYIVDTFQGKTELSAIVKEIFTTIKDIVKEVIEKIKDFIGVVTGKVEFPKGALLDIATWLGNAMMTITENSKDFIEKVWPVVKDALTSFSDFLKGVKNFFTDDGFKNTKDILKVGILVLSFVRLKKILDSLKSWADIGKSIKGVFDATSGYLNSLKKNAKFAAFKSIAISIGILAASIYLLAQLSWDEMIRGITGLAVAVGALIGLMYALNTKFFNGKDMTKMAASVVLISGAMLLLTLSVKKFAEMELTDLLKGVGAVAAILLAFGAMGRLMGQNRSFVKFAVMMGLVTVVLFEFAGIISLYAVLPIAFLAKGLIAIGIALVELSLGLYFMDKFKSGAGALAGTAVALLVLLAAIKIFSTFKFTEFALGLVMILGAIVSLSVTAAFLSRLAPSIAVFTSALLFLGAAIVVVGVGMLVLGLGLQVLGKGLSVFSDAFTKTLENIFKQIGVIVKGIITVLKVAAIELIKSFKEIIVTIAESASEILPPLVDLVLDLILKILVSLSEHIPEIIEVLCDIIIKVVDALIPKVPTIIQSLGKLVKAILKAFGELLKEVDLKDLTNVLEGFALISLMMIVLANLKTLGPQAMLGVLEMGVVILELIAILAAIGGISKIPGLKEIVESGGDLLQSIGTAIGQFIGGIIGGLGKGIAGSLPKIGADLSAFMTNLQPTFDIISKIDNTTLEKALILPLVIGAIAGSEVIKKISDFLTFGDSISSFEKDIVKVGKAVVKYANIVKDIDNDSVEASANAALTLAEFARKVPNEGGLIAKVFGDNDLVTFSNGLIKIGRALRRYYVYVKNIDGKTVEASANAALTLTEFAKNIPNEGGWIADVFGDNTLADFAVGLIDIGEALNLYYDNVKDIDGKTVEASANAAKTLAEFAKNIPNEGGLIATVFGDNTLTDFAYGLIDIGRALSLYDSEIKDIKPETVTASANAAKTLAEFANAIPNEGGWIAKIEGDNSISDFAAMLPGLGLNLSVYGAHVRNVDPETITASANALNSLKDIALTEMPTGSTVLSQSDKIANLGTNVLAYYDAIKDINMLTLTASSLSINVLASVVKRINGIDIDEDSFLSTNKVRVFAETLPIFGDGLKQYSDSITKDGGLNITAVVSSAIPASILAGIANLVPSINTGFKAFNEGKNDLASFGDTLGAFGTGLSSYSKSISGANALNISAMSNASPAIQDLVEIAGKLPEIKGLFDYFSGTTDLATFGETLEGFGNSLKAYSDSITANGGLDIEAMDAPIDAVHRLISVAAKLQTLSSLSTFNDWFLSLDETDKTRMAVFGRSIVSLGTYLKEYSDVITANGGLNVEAMEAPINAMTKIVDVVNSLGRLTNEADSWVAGDLFNASENTKLAIFGKSIVSFGGSLKKYSDALTEGGGLDVPAMTSVGSIVTSLTDASNKIKGIGGIKALFEGRTDFKKFGKTLESFGQSLKTFSDSVQEVNFTLFDQALTSIGDLLVLLDSLEGIDSDTGDNFKTAMKSISSGAITKFTAEFTNSDVEVLKTVNTFINNVKTGLGDGETTLKNAIGDLVTAMLTKFNSYDQRFYEAGKGCILGLKRGLKDLPTIQKAESAAYDVGRKLLNATQRALDSHSPSKEYEKLGRYCPIGLYNGVIKNLRYGEMAGEEVANVTLGKTSSILSKVSDILDSNINLDPVIRPVLDLDNIETESERLNAILSTDKAYSISARMTDMQNQQYYGNESPVNNYNFTQNNYSPKALSPIEIYRQTNNQFSAFQRRTKNV